MAIPRVGNRHPEMCAIDSYSPVMLETFVEKPRFTGTCYKAANWQNLGDTQGRGKLDRLHSYAKPVKSIWIYPLVADFRLYLCNT